ncbi:MAG: PAS domain S-box protein, partial [Pseudomonadales bacterium]|nr:PAS domain S-box protein [Pseudomonadales bacterium]
MSPLDPPREPASHDEALRASEDKFAKAFRTTPDTMVITDRASGVFIEVNPAFERQFGWSQSEAAGRTSSDLNIWSSLADRQRMLDALAIDGRLDSLEVELHHRDGRSSINLLYGAECRIDGNTCLVLTVRDVTRQRRQEQALQDSQERLSLALESAELGLWDWQLRSDQIYASARASKLHGLSEQPYDGPIGGFFKFIPEDEQRRALVIFRQLRDGQRDDFRITYHSCHADGSTRYLESTAKLYRDSNGQPLRMTGVLHDITTRTLREQALATSEEKFVTLFQASTEPVCLTRLRDGALLEVSPSFTQVFGWQADEVVGKTSEQLNLWLDRSVRNQLLATTTHEQRLDNARAQFRRKDGQILTCRVSARLIKMGDEDCLATTFRDETARELTERARQLSEEKFTKAFHASPDAITITERNSARYLEVNEGFTRLTGYSADEVLGHTALEINIWAEPSQRQTLLETITRDGFVRNQEMLVRNHSGDLLTVQVSVQPISIDQQDCLLLIARDISDLKQAQAQIQHLAYHDSLTNLPNRALLMDRLSQQISLLKRHNLRGALLFLDLDHFKHINDSL